MRLAWAFVFNRKIIYVFSQKGCNQMLLYNFVRRETSLPQKLVPQGCLASGPRKVARGGIWKLMSFTGCCSTLTLLLICSSFSRENGHPLLICSSLSTAHVFFSDLDTCHPPQKKNRFPQAKPCLGCNGLRMAKVGLIEGRKIWMILEAPEKISKRTTWDPETSESCVFQKDPHGWNFIFTVVFPTNHVFFNAVMSMTSNVLHLKPYLFAIRRMSALQASPKV